MVAIACALGAAACKPRCEHLCAPANFQTLTRLAGQPGGAGHVDGPLADAHVQSPWALACDGDKIYFTEDGKNGIRMIDLASGRVETLAGVPGLFGAQDGVGGEARLFGPSGIALHGGVLYIADTEHHLLRALELKTNRVTTLAGHVREHAAVDGPLAGARFNEPEGVAFDGDDLYVTDTDNQLIRKISLKENQVTTVAGKFHSPGHVDGVGGAARFNMPMAIAGDGAGHLYIGDTGTQTIRVLAAKGGAVTTLAAPGAIAQQLFVDGGDLIAALADSRLVRIDRTTGEIKTWLGAHNETGFVDGDAKTARFTRPAGICRDGRGRFIVADSGDHALRTVSPGGDGAGEVATLVGPRPSTRGGATDGAGADARFRGPFGLAWDPAGAYYVADTGNHTLRKVDAATGAVSTLAGAAGQSGRADGSGAVARFNHPQALALDGRGHLFVADTDNALVRRVELAGGAVTTLVLDGPRLFAPTGLAWADGALFVSDRDGQVVLRVDPERGKTTLFAGAVRTAGNRDGAALEARFNYPQALTSDGLGNLFLIDLYNQSIRRIAIEARTVTTIAGGRLAPTPPFSYPSDVKANGAGELFVADANNHVVRRVELASGRVTVVLGTLSDSGVRLGAVPAQLDHPSALALSDDGRLALFSENALLVAR